ncbi:hypothetical protein AAIR98_001603 [Elusimicrobium simillimum]|uniref:hypothetical protein n=1 Tax=Elusimicrobium simillimum TaxID=3143438 RepID=UPI003C6F5ECA
MSYRTIDIYGPGLIDNTTSSDLCNGIELDVTSAEYAVTFSTATEVNILVLKNSNLSKIKLYSSARVLLFESVLSAADIYLRLPDIKDNKIYIYMEAAANISVGSIKLFGKLLSLGHTSTQFSRSDLGKQGYYYLANSSLLTWQEYKKAGGRLYISNCSSAVRDKIIQAFAEGNSLVFHFVPMEGRGEMYDFALIKTPSEKYDVKTGLFELDLNLAER